MKKQSEKLEAPVENGLKLPTVLLRPGEADRMVAGHPWVYEGNILRLTAESADGALAAKFKESKHKNTDLEVLKIASTPNWKS